MWRNLEKEGRTVCTDVLWLRLKISHISITSVAQNEPRETLRYGQKTGFGIHSQLHCALRIFWQMQSIVINATTSKQRLIQSDYSSGSMKSQSFSVRHFIQSFRFSVFQIMQITSRSTRE